MKFTPVNSNFVFEPITTPNKNIQSYFMRSEQSFFTPESLKYPSYPSSEPAVQFLILDGFIVVNGKKIEHDFFFNSKMNITKYKFLQRCLDGIYSTLYSELKEMSQDHESLKHRTVPVQLIISDFMGRSDITSLIDVILNQLGFKAVMILPVSLCLSFHLNQNYSSFIYKAGFSFVDDFCLVDACEVSPNGGSYARIRLDDEDYAEEYSRLTVINENLRFSCDECGEKEDTEEKINSHIAKEHGSGSFFEYNRKDNIADNFNDRMRYVFNREKYEKISKKIYSVDVDFQGAERIGNVIEMAISGARLFSNLESSKDLWMTDHEWRNVRLRVLKEKLLFYI